MKCPVCKEANLVMTERQGIEIDYCPECRGVWLDRGELDKFIEHAERLAGDRPRGDAPERHERHSRDDEYRSKPRKSFLRDLFD
ncbi:MAG: zf-TFIIB domain-containing protein [Gammaproteobacteria bacterium]|nr:zf-TFIIB domain-containing protein [Gammaproteobacteria bacterium]